MREKIILFSLIGEFLIIIILTILVFSIKENTLKKCGQTKYIYRDEVNYTCLSTKKTGDTNTYQIKINITTDLKGRITKYQKLDVYAYNDDAYYKSMRDTYKIDSKYSIDFDDNDKTLIIDSTVDSNYILGTSYIIYDEYLISEGFTCSLVD